MTTKHTSGKWRVKQDDTGGFAVLADKQVICEMAGDSITAKANADLIAQSLVMLEEIKALVDSLSDPDIAEMEIPLGVVIHIMKLKERIKKIKGE